MTADRGNIPQSSSQKPLHVLTLTPFYPVQGDDAQGCFVAEPLPWLEQFGVTNTVRAVRPFYRRGATNGSGVPARWVRFFSFPGGWGLSTAGAFLFASLLPEIRHLHALHPVDVIHAHSALPCGHAATLLSRELKIPFVVTVHGLDAFSTRQVEGRAGRWCARISRSVYRSACRVICVSERVREQVFAGSLGPVNTTVLYNCVDSQMFSPAETETGEMTVLSVGNLIPTKGHDVLVRAFSAIEERLRSNDPTLALEIIGDGPERARLEQLAQELGIGDKVYFRGRRSRREVAQAMRRATVFALPSRYEALGCVYLEAMSAGKPVIACQGQGIEEVIRPAMNGCLIAPDDLQAMSDTLGALLLQPELRRKIGEAAHRTILEGFTLEQQAERLVRLYRECLA
jgi:teichuronic acid biosynthesis glycosyltransferase TuaC